MPTRFQYSIRGLIALAALWSIWLVSSEPWGLGVFQLLVFTGPGALLGLGAGFTAHATSPAAWSWKSARKSALVGAATLPPVLAFLIAIDGTARPQELLVGFVHAAWIALAGGAIVAALRKPSGRA